MDSGRHGPVNRPWRLVLGLPGALAAAVATAAFGLVSSPVWQISAAMGTERPWIATAADSHWLADPEPRAPIRRRLSLTTANWYRILVLGLSARSSG